jgi:hypothetical protein
MHARTHHITSFRQAYNPLCMRMLNLLDVTLSQSPLIAWGSWIPYPAIAPVRLSCMHHTGAYLGAGLACKCVMRTPLVEVQCTADTTGDRRVWPQVLAERVEGLSTGETLRSGQGEEHAFESGNKHQDLTGLR